MAATIRLAVEDDAAAVQAIYAPYVRETPISFELEPPDVEEMRRRLREVLRSHAWLVCCDAAGEVVAYAYAARHAERAAYRWSTDVAVYAGPETHRRGVGRGLYTALFALLRAQGYCNAFAGITLPNEKSVGLHTAMGFRLVGVYENVGFKFGRWHPVGWYGLQLQPPPESPGEPRSLESLRERVDIASILEAAESGVRL